MPFECPHCSKEIAGAMTQASLEQRLNEQRQAKQGEIKLLQDQLEASGDKAGRFDGVEAERDRLLSAVARLTDGATRRDQLAALGIYDATVHATFGILYDSAVAGLEGEDRPTFEAWLADEEAGARLNPVLAPMFNGAEAPEGTTGPIVADPLAVKRPATFPAPGTDVKAGPAPLDRAVDAGQIRKMLQNMSVDEVRVWQEQHGDKYGWSPPSKPATA